MSKGRWIKVRKVDAWPSKVKKDGVEGAGMLCCVVIFDDNRNSIKVESLWDELSATFLYESVSFGENRTASP